VLSLPRVGVVTRLSSKCGQVISNVISRVALRELRLRGGNVTDLSVSVICYPGGLKDYLLIMRAVVPL